jgi:hypothetical protein
MNKTPNFFIVGAPKARTDSLYYELEQHPDVYMSPLKEPCYFSSDIRPENFAPELQDQARDLLQRTREYTQGDLAQKRFGGMVTEWNEYLRLFAGVRAEKAIGEGSVCYLWSKTAANAIADRLPDSKIIIVLMDPAERAFAQFQKSVADGHVRHSFREHLKECFESCDRRFSLFHPFLEFGRYAEQIKRYFAVFPREQINISLYEDCKRDYGRWFGEMLGFLGVEKSFVPDKLGEPELPEMRSEDRALLVDFYRNDIRELADLIDRDLTAWLR